MRIGLDLCPGHPIFPSTMNLISLTPKQLRKAANIQERIQSLQKELNQIFGANADTTEPEPSDGRRRKRHKMSAAGRAAIAAAARERWARLKGTAPKRKLSAAGLANIRAGVAKRMAALAGAQPAGKPRRKRRLSPAARARLSALTKARWQKVRNAGNSTL